MISQRAGRPPDRRTRADFGALFGAGLLLAGCTAQPRPQPAIAPVSTSATARETGVRAGPPIDSLSLTPAGAAAALAAFRTSCPVLRTRIAASGLTRGADWQPACAAAAAWPGRNAPAFFAHQFETVAIGDGKAFATGYYEPEIAGARTAAPGFAVPVYRLPDDLVEVDLGRFAADLAGRRLRGRLRDAKLEPYPDRAAIEAGALAGRGLELAFAADPVEFFFLQIQGSGRLRLPDGQVMRIGYAGQNGRDYVAIGKLLRERGLIGPGESSMQGLIAWLRAHPDEGRAIMAENKSYIFFRELTGAGPIGALGVPVIGHVSAAADPAFVPLGAPLWLALDRAEGSGLWVAQDRGGAIKGANRFDTFWGAGEEARRIAGGMAARGTAVVLVPPGTLERLSDGPTPAQR